MVVCPLAGVEVPLGEGEEQGGPVGLHQGDLLLEAGRFLVRPAGGWGPSGEAAGGWGPSGEAAGGLLVRPAGGWGPSGEACWKLGAFW